MKDLPKQMVKPEKKALVIHSSPRKNGKKLFEGAVLTIKYFFDALGIPYRGELLIRGVDKEGDIVHHPKALSRAYQLGRQIASLSSRDKKSSKEISNQN